MDKIVKIAKGTATMIFSERYRELIEFGNGESKDNICGEVDYDIKKKIVSILFEFAEPAIIRPNRYDNYEITTNAFEQAAEKLNDSLGLPIINLDLFGGETYSVNVIGSTFTPHLFSLIELQYELLSNNEKIEFQNSLNHLFRTNNVQWLLIDGNMIKIDSIQFECDIRNKAIEKMHELKDSELIFQSAYNEFISALEFFEKGNYQEAISNAGKSYESILKVILGADRGNADKLTNQYMERLLVVPATMKPEGFREKVMMSLPYMRNNSGADHGAGAIPVTINKPFSKLAINLAAALDTFLIEEYQAELAKQTPQKTTTASENNNNDYPF